ncbi:hypothetical protein JTE90_009238 [Oedothorax gibbosus]|uniref:dolichyl-phosphate-mannose--protein mannosyltransferase n=1 Tax=Oedothorax gibbosus TaxID=931172 RepID=A0AAV6URN8_9ARAC|nr:hypothetical protein JTE90_009238 [Oedothorax gibbosus]
MEKYIAWGPCLIIATAFLCYLNSLGCGLVFDDQAAIRDNKDLLPTTPISNLLYNDFWGTSMLREESHKSYRPLCVFTFRLNFWVHDLDPFGYHLINVFLHASVCLLYHRLCTEILASTPSLIAALIFATHPIHCEAVTGVVGRAELLSSVFFLIALLMYIKSSHKNGSNDYKALFQCLVLSGLAMLSKEQGITVVAVCVTYDILLVIKVKGLSLPPGRPPRGKVKGPTPTWRKDLVLRLLVMTSGAMFMLVARMRLMGNRMPVFNRFDNPASAESWPIRQLTHHYLVSLNTWLLVFPSDLCCDWTMGTVKLVTSFCDVRLLATVTVYAGICGFAWRCCHGTRRNCKIIVMGLSLAIFPFLPASNLLYSVGFVVAERVLYLPSMGMCILIAHGFDTMCSAYRKQKHKFYVCIVILLCLYITKTVNRNFDWLDEETIFKSGLRVTSSNAKLYNNLGHVMESRGKIQEALQLFLKAAEVQPDDLGSHLNIGRMHNSMGMIEKAENAFRVAKELLPKMQPGAKNYRAHIAPRHLDLFLNLGSLLSRNESRLEEAQELYKEAISMKTDYTDAYIQRGNVLMKLNRSAEAHDMYKEALKHDHKNVDIFYNMGVLLLEQGKSHQALASFDQALQVDPQHEKSLLNYAILTQEAGDSSLRRLAHERLQVLLEKGSMPERTYFNLGILSTQDGDTQRAEQYFRQALKVRSDFESALFNLGLVLYEGGRALEALPHLQKLNPGHTKGMLLLGNIHFAQLRNYTAAMECYELVLKHDPANVPALHNLCATLFQMGRLIDAETCLLKAKDHLDATSGDHRQLVDHHLSLVRQRLRPQDHCSDHDCKLKETVTEKLEPFFARDSQIWR